MLWRRALILALLFWASALGLVLPLFLLVLVPSIQKESPYGVSDFEVRDGRALARRIGAGLEEDPVARRILDGLSAKGREFLAAVPEEGPLPSNTRRVLSTALNVAISDPSFGADLSALLPAEELRFLASGPSATERERVHRRLLETAFPGLLDPATGLHRGYLQPILGGGLFLFAGTALLYLALFHRFTGRPFDLSPTGLFRILQGLRGSRKTWFVLVGAAGGAYLLTIGWEALARVPLALPLAATALFLAFGITVGVIARRLGAETGEQVGVESRE